MFPPFDTHIQKVLLSNAVHTCTHTLAYTYAQMLPVSLSQQDQHRDNAGSSDAATFAAECPDYW